MAKLYINTPFLPVLAAWTSKPDKPYEPFDKDGKPNRPSYKVKLDITEDQLAAFTAKIRELIGDHTFPKTRNPKLGYSKAESDGKITLVPASAYKPMIFDMRKNKIQDPIYDEETGLYTNWKNDLRLGAGSIVSCACTLNLYDKGVSLQLNAIQVKKLVEWQSKGGASAFDVGEGYTADGDVPLASDEEEGDTDNGGSALDI